MSLTYSWDITGHDQVLQALENDVNHGNVAHAYLFSGPDSVGKFSTAQKFAHILQCKEGHCRACSTCLEIERGYHADTLAMADNGESVKIEEIRGVLEKLNMTKQSPYRIFLLQNIERMTLESANALLKTLEDPPERVVFLLTTSRVKDVIPTILSRVRLIMFRRLGETAMAALLQKFYPLATPEAVETVCSIALGRPGRALTLMGDSAFYEQQSTLYADIELFLQKPGRTHQFLYIEKLVAAAKEDGQQVIREFLDILQLTLRKQLLAQAGGAATDGALLPREKLLELLGWTHRGQELLKRNVNARLLLENMMLAL